jgi:hypothetical protein
LELFDDFVNIIIRLLSEIIINLLQFLDRSVEVHADAVELFEVILIEDAIIALNELDIEVIDLILEYSNSLIFNELILLQVLISCAHRRKNLSLSDLLIVF